MDTTLPTPTSTREPACQSHTAALRGFSQIKRYWDRHNGIYAAKILPGQFYVTPHNEVIVTVLGSCIAACIRDPLAGIGGMNHFMLPTHVPARAMDVDMDEAARYGNYAMELLINELLKHGGARSRLEIKLFGGGKIISQMSDVGWRNIEFVRTYIQTEDLRLKASDLGGMHPRKVHYFPAEGRVRIKKLRALRNNTIVERERHYLKDLTSQPISGGIDLF